MINENNNQSLKNSSVDQTNDRERDLYLRKLANGEIYGPTSGYPNMDKPWLKWYSEESILKSINESNNIYDHFMEMAPDNVTILEYYGRKYTKNDIAKKVEFYIRRFSSMGIKEGSTVSFIMLDVPEVAFMWMALSKLGAVTNLIKFDEGPERIAFMNNVGDADYMFVSEVPFILKNVKDSMNYENNIKEIISVPITAEMPKKYFLEMINDIVKKSKGNTKDKLKSLKKQLSEIKEMSEESKSIINSDKIFKSFNEWKNGPLATTYIAAPNDKDRTSIIVYTGGTTGKAKGVELTNKNIINMAHTFKYSELGFDVGKTSLNIVPPGVAYYLNATYALMCCGVTVNMISNFEISEYSSLIDKHKPNIFLSGPILLKQMAEDGVIKDASYVTDPISGGDKLHYIEEERINEFFKTHNSNAIVHQGYGESESTAAATYSKSSASVVGGIGIPLLNVEVGIFEYEDADEFIPGHETPKRYNEIGEICITGPTIMKGYKNNEEETKRVLRLHSDGKYWLHTDDLGFMDEDGRLFHRGRAKRMLTRAGNKVWLGTLEDVIKRNDCISDCCCVKFDDSEEREIPIAFIIGNDDFNESCIQSIDESIRIAQPESYVPKYYVIIDELPITEVNKKVDFKQLEKTDIFNTDEFVVEGKIIKRKCNILKRQK